MHIHQHWSLADKAANNWCAASGDMPKEVADERRQWHRGQACVPCRVACADALRPWRRERGEDEGERDPGVCSGSSSKVNGDDASVSRGLTRALHG